MTGMVHARDLVRILHHVLDLVVEPDIDRLVDQAAGHQGQEHGGNQGKADKGGDQLRAEPRPNEPMSPFEIGFDEIAREE